jgi:hypothetical protein
MRRRAAEWWPFSLKAPSAPHHRQRRSIEDQWCLRGERPGRNPAKVTGLSKEIDQ